MTDRISRRQIAVTSAAAAAALLPLGSLAQVGGTPSTDASSVAGETWSFTDDRGVTVTLPQAPTRRRLPSASSGAPANWPRDVFLHPRAIPAPNLALQRP